MRLRVRIPSWVAGARATLNGVPVPAAAPGSWLAIERTWRPGDRLQVSLPMRLSLNPAPDNPSVQAVTYGPAVLSAVYGDSESAPMPWLDTGSLRLVSERPLTVAGSARDGPVTDDPDRAHAAQALQRVLADLSHTRWRPPGRAGPGGAGLCRRGSAGYSYDVNRLGELERAIMDVLWESPDPLTVRQVSGNLTERDLAHTTVMTVLDRLAKKGFARRERDGRAWRYRAAATREAYVTELMLSALEQTGDRQAALARFARSVSDTEAAALRRALESTAEFAAAGS